MTYLSQSSDGLVIRIRVVPRAKATCVSGLHGDAVKIRLQAPPVDGKANKALVQFLASTLQVSASRIAIVTGETGRDKRVLVGGLSEKDVRSRLGV